jgi:hypothetical protein
VTQVLPSCASRFVKKFYLHETGYDKKSGQKLITACSNNTIVSRRVINAMGPTFHHLLNYTLGEDTLYFHQAYLKGFTIVWDNSILIEEPTVPERATTQYILYRWFRYGMNSVVIHKILHPNDWVNISLKNNLKISANIFKYFAASILRLDKRAFGRTFLNLALLSGKFAKLLELCTTNRCHDK